MTPARIKTLRARLGLTQRQLAAALTEAGYPVSVRTVEWWELGRPPGKLAAAGLAALNRQIDQRRN